MNLTPKEVLPDLTTVSRGVENETQMLLRRALDRLGPNGERWNHNWRFRDPDGRMCVGCAIVMATDGYADYATVAEGPIGAFMHAAAKELGYDRFADVNEAPDSTFATIRSMFLRAITLAGTPALGGGV